MFKPSKLSVLTFMSGMANKKNNSWGDKFSIFGGSRTGEVAWKQRYLILTNVGLLEYRQNRFDKPSRVFSVENMGIVTSEESYQTNQTLYNRPFVFILTDSDGQELVYSVGNRLYFQQWVRALRSMQQALSDRKNMA